MSINNPLNANLQISRHIQLNENTYKITNKSLRSESATINQAAETDAQSKPEVSIIFDGVKSEPNSINVRLIEETDEEIKFFLNGETYFAEIVS